MIERVADNLHRWTAPHPLWREGDDEGNGGWPQDVNSHLYERDGTATIFDPLVGDDPGLWAFLDERAAAAQRVVVALASSWHLRSGAAVAERYGGEIRLHRIAAGDTAMQGLERVARSTTTARSRPASSRC